MQQLTEQQILVYAPNAAAASNGKKISQKGGFVKLQRSQDDTFIWANVQEAARAII